MLKDYKDQDNSMPWRWVFGMYLLNKAGAFTLFCIGITFLIFRPKKFFQGLCDPNTNLENKILLLHQVGLFVFINNIVLLGFLIFSNLDQTSLIIWSLSTLFCNIIIIPLQSKYPLGKIF